MFKQVNSDINAASPSGGVSGDERVNHEVDNDFVHINEKTKTEILIDEEAETNEMALDTQLDVIGFSNKAFEMTEIIQRYQILNPNKTFWSSTDTTGAILEAFSLPRTLNQTPFMTAKLANFYAIKADMEIVVKVNPTPFQAGALAVVLHPTGALLTKLQAWTYYPHELINLPIVNNATINVPFFNTVEGYTTKASEFDTPWTVSVIVLTPLKSMNTNFELEVNVFGRYKDPELMIPQPTVEVPLAQARGKPAGSGSGGKTGSDNELEDQKQGLVTRISGTAADILEAGGTALSKIPFVGPFVPPLTWAARAFNKVSSYYGWCKPSNMEICKMMAPIPSARMCNAEGVDNSVVLGLSPDNTVNSNQNYTDIDEMDLSYLLDRKFVKSIQTLDASDTEAIIHIPVGFSTPETTSENLMNIFKWKRYMICFEFHFVKTNFHTGRLLIQYDYTNSISDETVAKENLSTVYSKIVDLSKQDRFIFTVPWMSLHPFDPAGNQGRLTISQFNDFVAAETVNSTIDIIVYQSYRDVQLGLPLTTTTWQGQPIAQAGGACCGNNAPIPTDDLIPYQPQSMEQYCMGEHVGNLRSLAKRFTRAHTLTITNQSFSLNSSLGLGTSVFGLINSMYYARAGSLRVKIHFAASHFLRVTIHNDNVSNQSINAQAYQIYSGNMNTVAEFSIPYYYPYRRSFDQYPWPDVLVEVVALDGTIAETAVDVYFAAGDDYNAMFPKGLAQYDGTEPLNPVSGAGHTDGSHLPLFGTLWYNSGWQPGLDQLAYLYPGPSGPGNLVITWTSGGPFQLGQWPTGAPGTPVSGGTYDWPELAFGGTTPTSVAQAEQLKELLFTCQLVEGVQRHDGFVSFKGEVLEALGSPTVDWSDNYAAIFYRSTSTRFAIFWNRDESAWRTYFADGTSFLMDSLTQNIDGILFPTVAWVEDITRVY